MSEQDEYTELIKSSKDGEEGTTEEVKAEEPPVETEEVETEPGEPTEAVITEELVKKYGLSKNLIGKPVDQLAEAYNNLQKFDTKLSMQVADLTRKMGNMEEKLSKKEVKTVEEVVEDKLPDYEVETAKFYDDDGFLTDKAGLAKFNKNYFDKRDSLLRKEFEKKLDEKSGPLKADIQKSQARENKVILYDNVVDGLKGIYEDVSSELVNKVIADFEKELDETDIPLYQGKMDKLAKAIIRQHKAGLYENKGQAEKSKSAADKEHKKQLEKLKENNKTFTRSASAARDNQQDVVDKDYKDLLEEAEQEADWVKK